MTTLNPAAARDRLQGLTVGIVYGPTSREDALYMSEVPPAEWSLTLVRDTLTAEGVPAVHLDPTAHDFVARLMDVDLVFVNAHGPFGEDGRLQGLLDFLGLPYTFSGVSASAIGMDKLVTKAVFRELGIPTPKSSHLLMSDDDPREVVPGWPLMVKAVDGGSSLGLRMVSTPDELVTAVDELRRDGFGRLFLEEFIVGRPVTLSVITNGTTRVCLPPLEALVGDRDFYDADAKLQGNSADESAYRIPDDLPRATLDVMEDAALGFGGFTGARGAYRVDFIVSDGLPYALEANTVPGLQRGSNLPAAAAEAGLSYADMLLLVCHDALVGHRPTPWSDRP